MLTFNKGNLLTLLGQSDRKERTGLAGADLDRVKFFCDAVVPASLRRGAVPEREYFRWNGRCAGNCSRSGINYVISPTR